MPTGSTLPVHFALLLPISELGSWDGGRQIAGAATLAVASVNADKTLLPGRVLEFSWADSGCSAKQGLSAMGKLLGGESRIHAVIGPGCSSACEVTSYLSSGQGVPQISYSCTSPSLSDKNEFFLFSRSVAPAISKTPTLLAQMRRYDWKKAVRTPITVFVAYYIVAQCVHAYSHSRGYTHIRTCAPLLVRAQGYARADSGVCVHWDALFRWE